MVRFWVEEVAAIELAVIALVAVTLGVTIVTWIAVRRSKRSARVKPDTVSRSTLIRPRPPA